MDAVELPLPADVVVSKILAKDGFARSVIGIEEAGTRFPMAGDSSVFGGVSVSGACSSSDGKIKFPSGYSTSKLVSKIGKDNDVCLHRSAPGSDCRDHSEQHPCEETSNFLPSAAEVLGKKINRKAGKMPTNSSPAAKRLRTGRIEDPQNPAGPDAKSRLIKLKCGIYGKRGDKKNSRMVTRTRNDAWPTRVGMTGSSAIVVGNDILGIYGVKSMFRDITSYMDNLSVNDLLDDGYRGCHVNQSKGKRGNNGNDDVMLAVRKACALLPIPVGAYSALTDDTNKSAEKHDPPCQLNKDLSLPNRTSTGNESECNKDLSSSRKDSCNQSELLENLVADLPLYYPKDILERLALPQAWSLDALLSQTSISTHLAIQKSYIHSAFPSYQNTCLPPFPWSLFPVGSSKPSNDSGKLSANKNMSLHKWVRIDSSNDHIGNAHGHPLNQGVMADADKLFSKTLEIDGHQENVLSSVPHCLSGHVISPCAKPHSAVPLLPQSSLLMGPPAKRFCCPSEIDVLRSGLDSQFKPSAELHSEKFTCHGDEGAEGGNKHEPNEELCSVQKQRSFSALRNLVIKTENPAAPTHEHNDKNSGLQSETTVSRCNLQLNYLASSDNSAVGSMLVGHSPRLLAAAQILCEISSCQNGMGKQNGRYSKIRWPCRSSQKVMKAPRTKASLVGKETCTATVRPVKNTDPVKVPDNVSLLKPKISTVDRKSNIARLGSVQRETIKWLNASSSRNTSKLGQISVRKSRQTRLGTRWPAAYQRQ